VIPPNLHAGLDRGLHNSRDARKMSIEEFLDHIAVREGVARDEAREHARAVFAALRELLSGRELAEMAAQFPRNRRRCWWPDVSRSGNDLGQGGRDDGAVGRDGHARDKTLGVPLTPRSMTYSTHGRWAPFVTHSANAASVRPIVRPSSISRAARAATVAS
jgi:hypothetical protein